MDIWVVGKYRSGKSLEVIWDIIGVFDSEDEALGVCRGHLDYFIGPLTLNEAQSDETVEWPNCYFPNTENGSHEVIMDTPRKDRKHGNCLNYDKIPIGGVFGCKNNELSPVSGCGGCSKYKNIATNETIGG